VPHRSGTRRYAGFAVLDAAKPRQSTNAPAHARDLEDVVLTDDTGQEVRLGDLWEDRPAVLVFLRHYG